MHALARRQRFAALPVRNHRTLGSDSMQYNSYRVLRGAARNNNLTGSGSRSPPRTAVVLPPTGPPPAPPPPPDSMLAPDVYVYLGTLFVTPATTHIVLAHDGSLLGSAHRALQQASCTAPQRQAQPVTTAPHIAARDAHVDTDACLEVAVDVQATTRGNELDVSLRHPATAGGSAAATPGGSHTMASLLAFARASAAAGTAAGGGGGTASVRGAIVPPWAPPTVRSSSTLQEFYVGRDEVDAGATVLAAAAAAAVTVANMGEAGVTRGSASIIHRSGPPRRLLATALVSAFARDAPPIAYRWYVAASAAELPALTGATVTGAVQPPTQHAHTWAAAWRPHELAFLSALWQHWGSAAARACRSAVWLYESDTARKRTADLTAALATIASPTGGVSNPWLLPTGLADCVDAGVPLPPLLAGVAGWWAGCPPATPRLLAATPHHCTDEAGRLMSDAFGACAAAGFPSVTALLTGDTAWAHLRGHRMYLATMATHGYVHESAKRDELLARVAARVEAGYEGNHLVTPPLAAAQHPPSHIESPVALANHPVVYMSAARWAVAAYLAWRLHAACMRSLQDAVTPHASRAALNTSCVPPHAGTTTATHHQVMPRTWAPPSAMHSHTVDSVRAGVAAQAYAAVDTTTSTPGSSTPSTTTPQARVAALLAAADDRLAGLLDATRQSVFVLQAAPATAPRRLAVTAMMTASLMVAGAAAANHAHAARAPASAAAAAAASVTPPAATYVDGTWLAGWRHHLVLTRSASAAAAWATAAQHAHYDVEAAAGAAAAAHAYSLPSGSRSAAAGSNSQSTITPRVTVVLVTRSNAALVAAAVLASMRAPSDVNKHEQIIVVMTWATWLHCWTTTLSRVATAATRACITSAVLGAAAAPTPPSGVLLAASALQPAATLLPLARASPTSHATLVTTALSARAFDVNSETRDPQLTPAALVPDVLLRAATWVMQAGVHVALPCFGAVAWATITVDAWPAADSAQGVEPTCANDDDDDVTMASSSQPLAQPSAPPANAEQQQQQQQDEQADTRADTDETASVATADTWGACDTNDMTDEQHVAAWMPSFPTLASFPAAQQWAASCVPAVPSSGTRHRLLGELEQQVGAHAPLGALASRSAAWRAAVHSLRAMQSVTVIARTAATLPLTTHPMSAHAAARGAALLVRAPMHMGLSVASYVTPPPLEVVVVPVVRALAAPPPPADTLHREGLPSVVACMRVWHTLLPASRQAAQTAATVTAYQLRAVTAALAASVQPAAVAAASEALKDGHAAATLTAFPPHVALLAGARRLCPADAATLLRASVAWLPSSHSVAYALTRVSRMQTLVNTGRPLAPDDDPLCCGICMDDDPAFVTPQWRMTLCGHLVCAACMADAPTLSTSQCNACLAPLGVGHVLTIDMTPNALTEVEPALWGKMGAVTALAVSRGTVLAAQPYSVPIPLPRSTAYLPPHHITRTAVQQQQQQQQDATTAAASTGEPPVLCAGTTCLLFRDAGARLQWIAHAQFFWLTTKDSVRSQGADVRQSSTHEEGDDEVHDARTCAAWCAAAVDADTVPVLAHSRLAHVQYMVVVQPPDTSVVAAAYTRWLLDWLAVATRPVAVWCLHEAAPATAHMAASALEVARERDRAWEVQQFNAWHMYVVRAMVAHEHPITGGVVQVHAHTGFVPTGTAAGDAVASAASSAPSSPQDDALYQARRRLSRDNDDDSKQADAVDGADAPAAAAANTRRRSGRVRVTAGRNQNGSQDAAAALEHEDGDGQGGEAAGDTTTPASKRARHASPRDE